MSASHGAAVATERAPGPLDRLAPEVKLAAVVLTVVPVALTPPRAWWAFAAVALCLVGLAAAVPVPARALARRMVLDVPVLGLAAALALLGGPEGRLAAFGLASKATIGLLAVAVLAACTRPAEVVAGLRRLRLPVPLAAVAAATVQSLDLLGQEWSRLQQARAARNDRPRNLAQLRGLAGTGGVLVVRALERAERRGGAVALRGGAELPVPASRPAPAGQWMAAAPLPLLAAALAAAAAWTP